MAYVRPHRNNTGSIVSGVFDRVTTEGDASRFNSAEVGYSDLFKWADQPGGVGYKDLQLSFDYIVGAKQLVVWAGSGSPVSFTKAVRVDDKDILTAAAWGYTAGPYFEELGSSSVRVYASSPSVILVEVPHTSLPAANREKVIIKDQGDNEALELRGLGDGVIMHSPNGAKWLVRIDNSGTLVVEPRG
jgi:hypothetical protein